jgi:quinol monooxygenase YgiN
MYARILEMKTKRGQARAFCKAIEEKGVPILRKYPGFVEELHLISEEKPDSMLAISLWQNKEAAERYRIESYSTIAEMYLPFLESGIQVRGYDVPFAPAFEARVAKAS